MYKPGRREREVKCCTSHLNLRPGRGHLTQIEIRRTHAGRLAACGTRSAEDARVETLDATRQGEPGLHEHAGHRCRPIRTVDPGVGEVAHRTEGLATVDQLTHERRRHATPSPRRIDGDESYVSDHAIICPVETRGAHADRSTIGLSDERDCACEVTRIPEPGAERRIEKRADGGEIGRAQLTNTKGAHTSPPVLSHGANVGRVSGGPRHFLVAQSLRRPLEALVLPTDLRDIHELKRATIMQNREYRYLVVVAPIRNPTRID